MIEWVLLALLIGSAAVAEVGYWKNIEWVALAGAVGTMVSGCLLILIALANIMVMGIESGWS